MGRFASASYSNYSTVVHTTTTQVNKFHGYPHDATCLTAAAERGLTTYVKLLLDYGADVNQENGVRQTSALHLCTKNCHADTLRLLLQNHADVSCRRVVRAVYPPTQPGVEGGGMAEGGGND